MFDVPKSPKIQVFTLSDFLGVDFTSLIPHPRRSPNMVNLINNNGYMETRPGYEEIGHNFGKYVIEDWVPDRINGIWNVTDDLYLVHAKDKLYSTDINFENETLLYSNMGDVISTGININDRVYVFDGTKVMVFYDKVEEGWLVEPLEDMGYVPTTAISRDPNGVNSTKFEDVNLIQRFRLNNFLADGESTEFKLDADNIDDDTVIVSQLTEEGNIEVVDPEDYSVNLVEGTVIFDTAPDESPVDGRDNIFIRFAKTNSEHLDYINKCTVVTTYGYDGNNNRLFVTGNPDYPNIDWFSEANNPEYFPAENFTKVGFEPIVNYLKLNDGTLAIQKSLSDVDDTIYYRTSAMLNGKEVFPISNGVKSIGCIGKHANANLLNNPLTLTRQGVYSIIGSQMDEKFAREQSYYIKGKLTKEDNLETAQGIVFQNKYYLGINNNIYIADSRYRKKEKHAQTEGLQYEWYYWENVPVRVWFQSDKELYFGTDQGKIMKFNDTCLDVDTPIQVHFETSFLDLGSIVDGKTIKRVTLISKPKTETGFVLGYITDEGDTDIITQQYDQNDFPRTLQEKEKIRNIMFVKFYVKNNEDKKLNFYQLGVEYVYTNRYRGE